MSARGSIPVNRNELGQLPGLTLCGHSPRCNEIGPGGISVTVHFSLLPATLPHAFAAEGSGPYGEAYRE